MTTRRFTRIAFSALVLLFLALSGPAGAEQLRIPLNRLSADPAPDLRGTEASFTLKAPVPERWEVQSARLVLPYVNSSAMLRERSRLIIRVNGIPLAQIALDPDSTKGEAVADIPGDLLEPGYNDLLIQVAQAYTYDCQDPAAPELWTTLLLDKGELVLDYSVKRVPPVLADLADAIFDPRNPIPAKVVLVLESLDEEHMLLAALAASGVALRYEYRPVRFIITDKPLPDSDAVVVGSPAFAASLLASGDEPPQGAGLSIRPLAGPGQGNATSPGAEHVVVCITGQDPESRLLAAKAFSLLSFPLPETPSMSVEGVNTPEISGYSGKDMLRPEAEYLFSELGFETTTMRGARPAPVELTFRLPSDIHSRGNEVVRLSLDFAHGSAMRSDSVLDLRLNDRSVASIALNDPKGARYKAYGVDIPAGFFKPGFNKLVLTPVLTPLHSDECTFIQTGNLFVTLFDTSTIKIPALEHWATMPMLQAFFMDGFPLATPPDWQETVVALGDDSPETAAAALNLIAMVAQKTGVPPLRPRFSYNMDPEPGLDMLLVSTRGALPESLRDGLPPDSELPQAFHAGHVSIDDAGADTNAGITPDKASPGALGDRLLLAQLRSPADPDRTLLMAVAENSPALLEGALALWNPSVQGSCKWGLSLVEPDAEGGTVTALKWGETYHLGQTSGIPFLNRLVYDRPWLALGLALGGFLLLALVLARLLGRRKKRRLSAHDQG